MDRQLLSREELRSKLNEELSEHDECKNCQLMGITELQEEDEDGCNWSDTITLRCGDIPSEICSPIASRIIFEARSKYNLRKQKDLFRNLP